MNDLFIYGAYGYTGRLIVDECLSHGIRPVIAGRDPEKTKKYAGEKDLEYAVFEVEDTEKMINWLRNAKVLIHCGGPFIHTAKPVIEACLKTDTHYLDITGEYQVFDLAQGYDKAAKNKNLMIMPGTGFDVVPSDCLAAHLKARLAEASDLQIAFMSKGGRLSRGTTKTMIENLGDSQVIRKNGKYDFQVMGSSSREVDFGPFKHLAMGITWGDISSAYYSTGIPNIEVFSGTDEEQLGKVKKMAKFSFVLKSRIVKNFLKGKLDKKPDGPTEEKREKSQMFLWGMVKNGERKEEAYLTTPNGYTLTAKTSFLIAKKILDGDFKPGYQTPSTAYGEGLILEVEGCEMS